MTKGYPPWYILHLCCCFRDKCIHPLCQQNVSTIGNYKWYEGGPPVNKLLLSVPDPKRPWVIQIVPGHHLKPAEILSGQ